jgi:dienelactone hydrolase
MTEIQFFKDSLGKTAYKSFKGTSLCPVFYLPAFRNDFESHKGKAIENICERHGLALTHFNYFGWGFSESQEVPAKSEGHVREWLSQAINLLDEKTNGPQVIVGYSMGGYLALALAILRPERIRAIVGIAPGFGKHLTENILKIYGALSLCTTDRRKAFDFTLKNNGSLPISGRLNIDCPVRFGHSLADKVVSPRNPLLVSNAIKTDDVTIFLSKNGSHRFDSPEEMEWLECQIKTFAT